MNILTLPGNLILALLGQTGWQPGIGDPTLMGWLTVLAYLLVALAGWHRSRTVLAETFPLSALLAALNCDCSAVGHQQAAQLSDLFTSLGRTWAWQQQWYAGRQAVQLVGRHGCPAAGCRVA
ncbi:MAG: hypothetical protein R3D55_18750 [Chloroflexota bacterium]